VSRVITGELNPAPETEELGQRRHEVTGGHPVQVHQR
jgi:hypothetical protein